MTYETAVIPKAIKPHLTIRHGLLGTIKTDRLIGDRKRTPTTISHCEGALRPARHTPVLSGDLDVSRPRPVMAVNCGDFNCRRAGQKNHDTFFRGPIYISTEASFPRRPLRHVAWSQPGHSSHSHWCNAVLTSAERVITLRLTNRLMSNMFLLLKYSSTGLC